MGQVEKAPRDERIRVRLLEAQRAESKALRSVERALASLQRAQRKRRDVLAIQDRRVQTAEQAVTTAQGALVDVSGVERAAQLLDLPGRSLRTAVKQATIGSAESSADRDVTAARPSVQTARTTGAPA
jgi:hypothetical protein